MLSVYQMGELEIYTIFWWSILRQCLNKLNFSDITRSVQGITEGEICWKPQVNMKPWITAFCRTREHFGDPLARLEGMDGCSACPLKWALWPYPAASSQDKKDGWQPKATGYCRKAGFKLFHWVITWLQQTENQVQTHLETPAGVTASHSSCDEYLIRPL